MAKAPKRMPLFEQPPRPRGRPQRSPQVRVLAVAHIPWNVEEGDAAPQPYIRLKGKWLAKAGFATGTRIVVTVRKGRLTITPFEEKKTDARNGR